MDQAMNVNDWYLFQGVGSVIGFHRVVGPRLMGLKPDESAIAVAMPRARVDARNLVAWLERMNDRPSMKATTWEMAAEMARAA
jgi:glutathione S-transferase